MKAYTTMSYCYMMIDKQIRCIIIMMYINIIIVNKKIKLPLYINFKKMASKKEITRETMRRKTPRI